MTKDLSLIKDLKEINKRYSLKVKVENTRPGIAKTERQQGIISDGSGMLEFIVWADSGKRYLFEGKVYIVIDALLTQFKGKLQIQIDKTTRIQSEDFYYIKKELENIKQEKKVIQKEKYKLGKKEKDIEHEKKIVQEDKDKTIKTIKYIEDKKNRIQQEKGLRYFGYILFVTIIISSGIYVYDFTVKWVIPRINDVIELTFGNKQVPYKVVADNRKNNIVTLESLDKYKEQLEFQRPMNLGKPDKESKNILKKHATSKRSKIYSYDLEKNPGPVTVIDIPEKPASIPVKKTVEKKTYQKPYKQTFKKPFRKISYIKPAVIYKGEMNKIVHVNSEDNDKVLMELPAIGPKRVKILKKLRPFYDLEDVMDSKIGIGNFWAAKWNENIKKGMIRFD